MAILSNNGGAINLPPDLLKDSSAPTLNTDLYEVVITDLEPNSVVPIQFAWVYPDKTVSEYSPSYELSTSDESTPNTPDFNISDVEWGNGFLKITWNGKDTTGAALTNIKQVNIWMRGGTFGATSVKTAHFFTGAGTKTITLPSGTYYVKLQAETALGKLSAFSNEIQSTSFKKPAAVSSLTAVWKKDDNTTKSNALKVNFTFDSTLETSTNSNLYATFFTIKLTGCGKSRSFSLPVDKSKTSHTWYLTPDMNKEFFGAFPFCGIFTVEVFVNDSFSLVSDSITITSDTYVTPLDTPVITVTTEVLAYNVAYNSQDGKGFDQVYVYENLNLGAGWVQRTQGTSNPIRVGTSGTEPRDVKVIFYDINGYSTAESNIVTGVTPKKADSTDTTPPAIPSVTAGTPTYNTIPITITITDADTKDVYVRYKKSTDSIYSYDSLPVTSGSNAWTIKGLSPSTVYNIGVSGGDSFKNYSAYSTNINATTTASSPTSATAVTVSNLNSGVGVLASWTAPSGSPTLITKYKVELYKDPAGTNTLQQTQYSFSTNISFVGLAGSSVYKILVYAQDDFGVFAPSAASSNFTTNALGGISDGIAPASSPTPTVTALYGALEVRWTAITNADIVTYEVHASTTSGFTPSISTKVLEVTGTFAIIKTISGTALTYGTTYYVKLIAKDIDGSAPAGAQASQMPSKVDNGDLATDSVRANVILAGTITATQMDAANLFVGKSFQVGTGGIIYSGAGAVFNNANTGFYLDSTGQFSLKDKLSFTTGGVLTVNGVINADSGDLKGALTVNSGTMKIGKAVQSTNDGIYINSNNYWYSGGLFRAGGTGTGITSDGTNVSLVGAVTITGTSTVTGNLGVTGTIYSGASASTGNRVVMNPSGIFAYDGVNVSVPTTSIINSATTAGGTTFKTLAAELGNWLVNSTSISNNGISITAPNTQGITSGKPSIIANRGAYYVGIQTPAATPAASDVVLWAGLSSDGSGSPGFKVTADGKLNATGAIISGTITGSTFTSTNYASGDGIRIYSAAIGGTSPVRYYEEFDMQVGYASQLRLSANSSGTVIWGPAAGGAYISMSNSGLMGLNAGTVSGAWVVLSTAGYAYQAGGSGNSTAKAYRNIEALVLAPSLATGAAASSGYTPGEILVTY